MMWMLLVALSGAQECGADLPTIAQDTSVVWVSRAGKRARGKQLIAVTPTTELRGWLRRQDRPTVGDMLRHLGLRRRKSEPRGRYKVVVFDADDASLCRPIEGEAPGTVRAGLPVCEPGPSRASRKQDGCGRAQTRDGSGAVLVKATWNDLSAAGFCVLPATRFVDEAS